MELKNCIFAHVYDWLHRKGMVADQLDLANKTGLSKNTITNILKGNTKVSDKTIRKLNEGFGNMFNMQYLRGIDPYHMLIQDLIDEGAESIAPFTHKPEPEQEKQKQNEPDWSDALLYRQTQQEKEMEELRRMLKATLEKVDVLTDKIDTLLKTSNYQIQTPNGAYLSAAEPNK